jgi:hypothetical protein
MRVILCLLLSISVLGLFGCDDSPAERNQKMENAADKTGDAMKKAAEATGDALDKAADSTGEVMKDISDRASKVKVDVNVATKPGATQPTDATTAPAAP